MLGSKPIQTPNTGEENISHRKNREKQLERKGKRKVLRLMFIYTAE
ncbi:hypothetical protein AVEN_69680-1, partial [Araneus ventricosus]